MWECIWDKISLKISIILNLWACILDSFQFVVILHLWPPQAPSLKCLYPHPDTYLKIKINHKIKTIGHCRSRVSVFASKRSPELPSYKLSPIQNWLNPSFRAKCMSSGPVVPGPEATNALDLHSCSPLPSTATRSSSQCCYLGMLGEFPCNPLSHPDTRVWRYCLNTLIISSQRRHWGGFATHLAEVDSSMALFFQQMSWVHLLTTWAERPWLRMWLCVTCVQLLQGPEESLDLELGMVESPCGCRESNSCPLQEQVFLTTDPSSRLPCVLIFLRFPK